MTTSNDPESRPEPGEHPATRPSGTARLAGRVARTINRRRFLRRGAQSAFAAATALAAGDATGIWGHLTGTASAAAPPAAGGLTITGRPVGPSPAQVEAAAATMLGDQRATRRFAAATTAQRQVLARRAIDDGAAGGERVRSVVHDYAGHRTLVLDAPLADPTRVEVSEAPAHVPAPPSGREHAAAVEVLRREAAHLLPAGATTYRAMPASTTRQGPDGRARRVVPVGLAWPAGGALRQRVVGVDLAAGEVIESMGTLVREVQRDCGDPADDGCDPTGEPAGQAHVQVNDGDTVLWDMVVVRPAASSGAANSGLEIRDLHYRGQLVLRRAHTPIINVQYLPNEDGCGPSYRDWGGEESCFQADGENLAPGIRQCDGRPSTIMDDDHVDGGNFRGVAIYQEDSRTTLVTELNAGWYRYVSEFHLYADGTIEPRFGFAAVRNPCTCREHVHHAYWRLEFDLGGSGSQRVEEFNDPPLPGMGKVIGLRNETRRLRAPGRQRHWRVRSVPAGTGYELRPGEEDGAATAFGVGDLWVLRTRPDELDDSAVATSDAAALDHFVNPGESVLDTQLVLWYAVHRPHLPDQPHPDRVGPTLHPIGTDTTG